MYICSGVQQRLQVETRPEGPHRGPLEREEGFVPRVRLRHQTVVDFSVPPAQPHRSADAVRDRELHLSDDQEIQPGAAPANSLQGEATPVRSVRAELLPGQKHAEARAPARQERCLLPL